MDNDEKDLKEEATSEYVSENTEKIKNESEIITDSKDESNQEESEEKNTSEIESKEKENTDEDSKEDLRIINKKKTIPIIFITVILCFILVFSVIFALININNEKILSGIFINGIEVSGLTKQEAIDKLNDVISNKMTEEMTLKYNEYETTINATQFNAKFDVENAVNQCYNIGRDGNIVYNNYKILQCLIFKKNIDISIYYNEEILNNKIRYISSKIPGAVTQSSYYIEDENLIIVKGKSGVKINEDELESSIIEKLNRINNKYDIVQIPTQKAQPDEINLEKIRQEIYKEPQNAYVSKNPTTVHPHVNGVDFKISIQEAQKLLDKSEKECTIPLKITIPNKTIKDLGEEAFPDQLSNYTTRYDSSNSNRSNNISIAASKINGTIVMPGETFSYNKVVGARTIQAGYKVAGAYAGGKVVQNVGGGICQTSSTLYNAALLANLEITDRSNHAFLTGYVAPGRDATVSWGSLDFKFKNSRKYPIKILASAKNGICKVSIHGIKEENEYEVVIQSKVLSYLPYTTKYVEDSSLEAGKEVVEQYGQNGCKSEAYRILKLNGKVISKTLLSKDTYDPMNTIIRRGTGTKNTAKITSTD